MEGLINALERVQKKETKCANLTNVSNWESLAQRRAMAALIVLSRERTAESGLGRLWDDREEREYCLNMVGHGGKLGTGGRGRISGNIPL